MTPEQQVAYYTPNYSWVELLIIGIILAAAFVLPTVHALFGRGRLRKGG